MIHYLASNYLLIMNWLASAFLLAHCLLQLNHMNFRSNHLVRGLYILLAVGAAGVLLAPLYDYSGVQLAEAAQVISNIGAAGLLWGGFLFRNRRASDVKERQNG